MALDVKGLRTGQRLWLAQAHEQHHKLTEPQLRELLEVNRDDADWPPYTAINGLQRSEQHGLLSAIIQELRLVRKALNGAAPKQINPETFDLDAALGVSAIPETPTEPPTEPEPPPG